MLSPVFRCHGRSGLTRGVSWMTKTQPKNRSTRHMRITRLALPCWRFMTVPGLQQRVYPLSIAPSRLYLLQLWHLLEQALAVSSRRRCFPGRLPFRWSCLPCHASYGTFPFAGSSPGKYRQLSARGMAMPHAIASAYHSSPVTSKTAAATISRIIQAEALTTIER